MRSQHVVAAPAASSRAAEAAAGERGGQPRHHPLTQRSAGRAGGPAARSWSPPSQPPAASAAARYTAFTTPAARLAPQAAHGAPDVADRGPATGSGEARGAVGQAGAAGGHGARRGLTVDRPAWSAWLDGRLLDLTYLEFEVLDFLVRHPGRVYSRADLLRQVWGQRVDDDPGPGGRTVDVLVTRLRRKLGPEHRDLIETVRRVGYRYRPAGAGRDRL